VQQQSNLYVIVFSAIITIVLGGLLAMANQMLKPRQQRSIELDTKGKILGAVIDLKGLKGDEILDKYNKCIQGIVVDINGDIVESTAEGAPISANDVDVAKNYKVPPEDRLYPVFKFHEEGSPEEVQAYIIPVYGKGLWGSIWGYMAMDLDLNTIKGAVFDHESETPGLGARITENAVQERYEGKKIYDESGKLLSVDMLKGENNAASALDDHHIDGLSGATITAKGLNAMLMSYFEYYSAYFQKTVKTNNVTAAF
jgi:Na+-transporting NADH:ubiquinone oxidoreductase subunit C